MRLAGFACRTGQPGDITAPGAQTCVKLKRILTGKPLASFPIARRCPSYHIFVPSRGNEVIDCRREVRERRGLYPVSVPSRGNGVIDYTDIQSYDVDWMYMFPSPLGEMGLSISTGMKSRNGWTASFGFPSPLGEMGLSILTTRWPTWSSAKTSFRPLSGKWGYRYDRKDQS